MAGLKQVLGSENRTCENRMPKIHDIALYLAKLVYS
jgi:hypothetical protein